MKAFVLIIIMLFGFSSHAAQNQDSIKLAEQSQLLEKELKDVANLKSQLKAENERTKSLFNRLLILFSSKKAETKKESIKKTYNLEGLKPEEYVKITKHLKETTEQKPKDLEIKKDSVRKSLIGRLLSKNKYRYREYITIDSSKIYLK